MIGLTGPLSLGHSFVSLVVFVGSSLGYLLRCGVLEAANCSNASELASATSLTKDIDLFSVSNFTPSLLTAVRSLVFNTRSRVSASQSRAWSCLTQEATAVMINIDCQFDTIENPREDKPLRVSVSKSPDYVS